MKFRNAAASILILIAALVVSACGSSGSSTGGNQQSTTTITGTVYAASVSGASVVVKNGSGTTVAGPVATTGSGSYSVNVPTDSLSSDLRIESVSGSYTDEATGTNTTAGTLAAYITGGTLTANVVNLDPSSTIVHALVTQYGMTLAQANAAFSAAFGYTPDTSIAPKNAATDGTDDAAQRLAGLHAGVFSQLTKDLALTPDKQFDLLAAIAKDLADGSLNGKDGANVISLGTGTLPEDIANRFENSLVSFLSNTACNLTGLGTDEIGTMPFSKVALTDTYRIEYIPGTMSASQGKTTFKLSVTSRATGTSLPGLTVSLLPMMHMASHEHSTPVDAIVDNGDGTYTCTVYYLMSASMSGMSMGFWELEVTIGSMGGESATFYPTVGMNMMISGDVLVSMKSQGGDIVSTMSGTSKRSYYIFNDGLTNGMSMGTGTLKFFIAANDYSMMKGTYPALSSGVTETTTLHDGANANAAWSAYPVTVEACLSALDCTAAGNWTAATNSAGGHWSVDFGSGISSGVTNTVYVRLLVGKDGGAQEQKTSNGMTYDGSTGYDGTNGNQTIKTTPGSM